MNAGMGRRVQQADGTTYTKVQKYGTAQQAQGTISSSVWYCQCKSQGKDDLNMLEDQAKA